MLEVISVSFCKIKKTMSILSILENIEENFLEYSNQFLGKFKKFCKHFRKNVSIRKKRFLEFEKNFEQIICNVGDICGK